ncbi:SusC/RagA family TonB-linked outer membrane protein [Mucilaginibacter sp. AW1-3]
MKKNLLSLLLLSLFALGSAFAQSRKITGTVTGDDGMSIPGVSVKVQGSSLGTQTNALGEYSITVPQNAKSLVFSYIGFATKLVAINGATINVKLTMDARALVEVVVTDTYGVQNKKSYTGATATVSGADNENKPFSTFQQALQGEFAGVAVTSNSGQPGANVQIRIRGLGSTALNSNPLYVIDGMIVNSGDLSRSASTANALAGINDNDIESFTVLKDAAATAIYGSRGANGVIVITTKKGKGGKTQVRFDAEFGISNNTNIPDAGKPLSPEQYKAAFIEALTNNGGYSASQIAGLVTSYNMDGAGNDWYPLVTHRGQQQQFNVSLSGGDEKTKIFSSVGYFKQDATVLKSNLRRITGLINIDHNINKEFSTSTGINVSNIQQNTPLQGSAYFSSAIASAYFLLPFQMAYNADGSINSSTTGNANFPTSGNSNPLYIAANDVRLLGETRVLGNQTIKWNIWDQLKYTGYASVDFQSLEETTFLNPTMGDAKSLNGSGTSNYTRFFNWLVRNQLDYRYNIPSTEDFYIDASIGYEAQRSTNYYNTAYATNYPATQPLLTAVGVASAPATASELFSNYTFAAFYSRAVINYKNKYSLSGSYRNEGSSRFGTNNIYGSFYSIGGAWSIDQESFFTKQHLITTAKLRASYGKTGNANGLANYAWRPTAGYGSNYNLSNGQNFNTIGNIDLTWESSKKTDIGLDIAFFKDRLGLSFDYYHNSIDGLIQTVNLSRTTGFSTQSQNIGAMLNKGVELSITGVPVRTKDFTWKLNFNVAHNANTMTRLANPDAVNGSYWLAQGMDYYTYYTRLYAGADPANGNALWYTDATKTATTTTYTAAARVPYAQADPKVTGGLGSSFTYKGFTLSADAYGSFGNRISDSWSLYLQDGAQLVTGNKYQYSWLNRWTTPGQVTDVPKLVYGGGSSASSSSFSTRFLYYGDFIRLKNVSLGYDFKNIGILKKIGISKLYVYGRATNLYVKTYDNRLPFDPEVPVTGFSTLDIPPVRTFTMGINVGL